MFFGYCILFAAVLITAFYFCAIIGGETLAYILGFLIVVAALAALASILTKLRDLEEKLDKLLKEKKDEHEE